jgi:hypothetical protein
MLHAAWALKSDSLLLAFADDEKRQSALAQRTTSHRPSFIAKCNRNVMDNVVVDSVDIDQYLAPQLSLPDLGDTLRQQMLNSCAVPIARTNQQQRVHPRALQRPALSLEAISLQALDYFVDHHIIHIDDFDQEVATS